MVSARQNMLVETHALRQQAVELLAWLETSQKQVEGQLKSEQREDMVRLVAGRSAMDEAILQTRRVIESLDRAASEAREIGENGESAGLSGAVQVVGRLGAIFGQPGMLAGAGR